MSDLTQNNQRLLDLVRQCRHTLHTEGLITTDEFDALVMLGSGSARRLEDYDELRAQLSASQAELAALRRDGERSDGARLIQDERIRQMDKEGWSMEHDTQHANKEITFAAIAYLYFHLGRGVKDCPWPWEPEHFKPIRGSVRNLVKAGALIAAEIDRCLDAAQQPPAKEDK